MLKKTVLATFATLVLCAPAWGSEGHAHSHDGHHHGKMEKSAKGTKPLDDKTKGQLQKVMEANETLHQSFFEYDKNKVQANAKKLHDMIKNIQHPELSKLLKYSSGKLLEIKASSDRKANNQIYHTVSMSLIHVLKTYDTGLKHQPYYCPMVKMKWVQNPEKMSKVHNPYAPEMPHCGGKDHT